MPIHSDNKYQDEISLKELILQMKKWTKYLVSKWSVILLCSIIGAVIGFLYAYFEKPVFTSTSVFVLEENGGNTGGMLGQYAGLASMVGVDIAGGGGLFQGDNIIELYRSRKMMEKALLSSVVIDGKRLLLVERYIEFNELRDKWKGDLKTIRFDLVSRDKFNRKQDSIIGKIVEDISKNYLSVNRPDKKLSIIKVLVTAKDEPFAKLFNDQIVKNVNDFYVQTKTRKAEENLAILQHQTDSVRDVMNGAIYTSAAIADATPNLNRARQILRAPVQKAQVNAEANKAILTQLIQNLELAKISLRKETPLIQMVDQPIYPIAKKKLGKAKGAIFGGAIFALLALFTIVIRKIYKSALSDG